MSGIVMLAGRHPSASMVYYALSEEFQISAVLLEDRVPLATFLAHRIKKLGFRVVSGQVLFKMLALPLIQLSSKRRVKQIIKDNGLKLEPIPKEVVIHIDSVNSDEAMRSLIRLAPDVVVVSGTRIIAERILNCTTAFFINTHVGITPLYRGVHGAYWSLVSDDRGNCGVTVHRVDAGIDTGSIISQRRITPGKDDTFVTYPLLQTAGVIPLLKRAIKDVIAGTVQYQVPPMGKSQLWTHPTLWQYLRGRFVSGIR